MSAAADRPPDDRWVLGYRAIGDDEFPDIGRVHEVPIVPSADSDLFSDRLIAAIVELPHEILGITELSPYDGTFVGKRIQRDGSIAPYPNGYALASGGGADSGDHPGAVRLSGAGAEAQYLPDQGRRRPTWRGRKRGVRKPAAIAATTALPTNRPSCCSSTLTARPATGGTIRKPRVRRIVAQLGEPWASASFVWFFSAGHGLEMETVDGWR